MQNRVYIRYIYVGCTYAPKMGMQVLFFLLKTRLFRLDPTFFWYYSIKKILLETWAPNCEIIPAKRLFFKSQKVTATGYYGIENPLLGVISKLCLFGGLHANNAAWLVGCQVPLAARIAKY